MLNAKLCKICGQYRELKDWWKSSTTKDGLQTSCRFCQRDRQRNQLKDEESKKRKAQQGLAWRARHPEAFAKAWKRSSLKRQFGITEEQYDCMLTEQEQRCAICRGIDKRALAVDHCHTTGKIRGLLCSKCNTGLGLFRDDPYLLEQAVVYLRRSK